MEIFYSSDIQGDRAVLDKDESGHCVKVKRHRAGDEICVIDGSGDLLHCVVDVADPRETLCSVVSREAGFGSHPYSLTMAVCPTKNADRFEWFVEKATEIGVDCIAPVIGDHSERKVFKTERVGRLVLSAAKQSLKGRLPEVREAEPVKDFILSADDDSLRLICYCFEEERRRVSVKDALSSFPGRKVTVLIGPEGDFSPAEVQLALAHGWQPVHLGSSRLRTETAALTAVTAVYMHFME